jgi:Flp pilus assembly protein TadD
MAPRRLDIPPLLVVPLLLATAAYRRVLHGDFVFDDVRVVQRNLALQDLGGVLRGFGESLFHGGRPTTEVTFAVSHALGGPTPLAFHSVNLLLHLAVVVLVFLFTRSVLRLAGSGSPQGVAVAVAGVFALHPLQSQAVSYVSQRSEVLASGLYLATLLLLLEAGRRGPGLRGALLGVAALAVFTLGMGAKTIVVTAPVAYLLLLALADRPRHPPRAAGPGRGPGGARWDRGALRRGLLRSGRLRGELLPHPVASRGHLRPAARLAVRPERGLVLPHVEEPGRARRAALRGPPRRDGGRSGRALVAMPPPGRAAGRAAAFGVAWFFLVLAPTSSFVPIADNLVEHRVYLASWGLFLAAVLGGERLLARVQPRRRAPWAALAVGATWTVLAIALHQRNAVWETDLALWNDVVARAPFKARARLGLGTAKIRHGDLEGAATEFAAGLSRVAPDAPALRVSLLHNLGGALIRLGRAPEAVAPLRQVMEIEPGNSLAPQSLAIALWSSGDLDGAESMARSILARTPENAIALRVMGQVRLARGDDAGAVTLLERAIRADPADASLLFNLGGAYANLGRAAEACASWRAVLRLRAPEEVRESARKNLAILGCPP